MTLEEFHAHQARMRRGRRWSFFIAAVCLAVLALCLAACSPALLRIETPRGLAQELKDAPVYVPPGKAPVQARATDESLNRWLKDRTHLNQLHPIPTP